MIRWAGGAAELAAALAGGGSDPSNRYWLLRLRLSRDWSVPGCALEVMGGRVRRELWADVEMQHILPDAQFGVQGDRGIVDVVGLDEDDPGSEGPGVDPEVFDHRGGDAATAVVLVDGQVVDVDLASGLLEFRQDVGSQTAHDLRTFDRGDGDEGAGCEKVLAGAPNREGAGGSG